MCCVGFASSFFSFLFLFLFSCCCCCCLVSNSRWRQGAVLPLLRGDGGGEQRFIERCSSSSSSSSSSQTNLYLLRCVSFTSNQTQKKKHSTTLCLIIASPHPFLSLSLLSLSSLSLSHSSLSLTLFSRSFLFCLSVCGTVCRQLIMQAAINTRSSIEETETQQPQPTMFNPNKFAAEQQSQQYSDDVQRQSLSGSSSPRQFHQQHSQWQEQQQQQQQQQQQHGHFGPISQGGHTDHLPQRANTPTQQDFDNALTDTNVSLQTPLSRACT